MPLPPIILASASPRRADLLRQLEFEFKVVVPRVVEVQSDQLTPRELCQINAYRKARAVAKQYPDNLVLGADTLVCLETEVFGKPADPEDAARVLSRLQGRMHEVVTGVSLIHLRAHRQRLFVESTSVRFRPLSAEQIADYLRRVNPLDKAGAYGIQEHGELIVSEVFGSFSNVVGLPAERLEKELEGFVG